MSRTSSLELTAAVLRDPVSLVGSGDPRRTLQRLATRLLAIAIAGAAVFGLVVGSYRGGVQTLYAAIKMPLLLLVPVVVTLPAIRAVYATCEVHAPYARLALATLVAMARTAVLAAACAPVLWLLYSMGIGYHVAIVTMAACLVMVGVPGLATIVRSLPAGGRHRFLAATASIALVGSVLAQTGWLLRPFVARPRAEVAFVRPVEADVFSSLRAATSSARGRYRGWDARPAGFLGREKTIEEPAP